MGHNLLGKANTVGLDITSRHRVGDVYAEGEVHTDRLLCRDGRMGVELRTSQCHDEQSDGEELERGAPPVTLG